MANFPAAGYISNAGRTEGEQKTAFEDWLASTKQLAGGAAEPVVSISGNVVTPTTCLLSIDTEGGAASDTLTNIAYTNLPDGSLLFIRCANSARAVIVVNAAGGVGQIVTAGFINITLRSTHQWLLLKRTGTVWEEISRGGFVLPQLYSRLEYMSTTQIRLQPGVVPLWTDGTWRLSQVADAGVNLSNGGLAASTFYFVYATASGIDVALEASTAGPNIADGVRVKVGDITRTLVGAIFTSASGQFTDTPAARMVVSFYERRQRHAVAHTASASTPSTTDALVGTGCAFILWDDSAAAVHMTGTVSNSGANETTTNLFINSVNFGVSVHGIAAKGACAIARPYEPGAITVASVQTFARVTAGTGTWTNLLESATFPG